MPTAEQAANLNKLADYLDGLPDDYAHFKMATYVGDYGNDGDDDGISYEFDLGEADTDRVLNCGTCACAVGHGPLAGIRPLPDEAWHEYEERAFGVSVRDDDWEYLFGPYNPDDAKAAASRIREYLKRTATT